MSKYIIRDALPYDKEFQAKWNRLDPAIQQYYLDVQDGKRSISFYNDVVFKKLLDPDTQKQRLSQLLSLILTCKVEALHSIRNESTLTSIYSKWRILDIAAILDGGQYVNLEMQVIAENYAGQRAAVYSCDLVNRQYSINDSEKKSEYNFGQIKPVYSITLLKESPAEFAENPHYIHRFRQESECGVQLNLLQEYVFIELDKYLSSHADKMPESLLDAWIAFIGTDSVKTKLIIMEQYPEFEAMNRELIEMSFDRKELMAMTDNMLEIMERNTLFYSGKQLGIQEGMREGKQEGKQEVAEKLKKMGLTPEQIREATGLILL